jgi:hypothetical protein
VDTEPVKFLLAEGEGSGAFRSLLAHGVEPVKLGVTQIGVALNFRALGDTLDVEFVGDDTSAVGYNIGWFTSGM